MTHLTEAAIEDFAIKLFEQLGYTYLHAPDIAPDSDTPERSRYDDVFLTPRLEQALHRINPSIAPDVLQTALKEVQRRVGTHGNASLLTNNEAFHRLLTAGVKVSYQQDGNERGDLVWLIDFANPDNNELDRKSTRLNSSHSSVSRMPSSA